MTNHFSTQTNDITHKLSKLYDGLPKSLGNFTDLADLAFKDGKLTKKTKELMALAMSMALRSKDCVLFHLQTLIKQGLSREELIEIITLLIYMGGGPALIFAADVLSAFEELSKPTESTANSATGNDFSSAKGYEE